MKDAGERYRLFIERHEMAWELAFAVLAIVFVVAGLVPEDEFPWVWAFDWLLTGVFALEFFSRLAVTPSRRDYLRGHWIDLVALVPPLRAFRVLRLARLLRLLRAFAGMGRAMSGLDRFANHRGLMWLFVSWSAVMVVCSIVVYAAENGPVNPDISSPLDALWWGITTMTTVGYGDVVPKTVEGKLAAVVLMVLGIGLYSAITAVITSALLTDRRSADPAEAIRSLAALRDQGHISDAAYEAKRDELLARL